MSLRGGTTKQPRTMQTGYAKSAVASCLAMTNLID